MLKHLPVTGLLAICALAASGAALDAARAVFWQVSTEAEFLAGDTDNIALDVDGRMTLGVATDALPVPDLPVFWTVVAGPDGSWYMGSGNEGQVLRMGVDGTAAEVWFDSDELEAHAVAPLPDGRLLVGTSPDGRVYRVDSAGQSAALFDPEETYVWSILPHPDGHAFIGTGDPGVVYRVEPSGASSPVYETAAGHAMALAFDVSGNLLVGTASPARVIRIGADGRAFVLFDAPYEEIHRLRVDDDGTVYAVALGAQVALGTPADSAGTPVAQPATTSATGSVTTAAPPSTLRGDQAAGTGAVYRILAEGGADRIWTSAQDVPFDVLANGTELFVATGPSGKVFRLTGEQFQPTLYAEVEAQQITSLLQAASAQLVLVTSNPGRLVRTSAERATTGTYHSVVRDAGNVATWGTLTWQNVGDPNAIVISTRSGNAETPDETWSDWSAPYGEATGSPISSPPARFLQWRAILNGTAAEAPLLSSVTAAYLPRNTPPRVASVTVHPPGTVFQRTFPPDPGIAGFDGGLPDQPVAAGTGSPANGASTPLGRALYERGLLTIAWEAEDGDQDRLRYEVLYRRDTELDWTMLASEVSDTYLVWDTTSVPGGQYRIRVIATDELSNSPATRLTDYLDTRTFNIDNAPPEVVLSSVTRDGTTIRVAFVVRDDDSLVSQVEYSIDGTDWTLAYPADGITDSRVETFNLELADVDPSARSIVVRARDQLSNLGSAQSPLPASEP